MSWDTDMLQWPAAALTVAASWFVASNDERRRKRGFWLFMASNVAWIAWGLPAHAHAVVALQVCLAAMNIRGARKARRAQDAAAD
jgi:hypothetical protein